MSQRIKRQLSKAGGSVDGSGGGGGGGGGGSGGGGGGGGGGSSGSQAAAARKRRRIDHSASDDEERSVWTPKHLGDLRAYNRSASEAPAELFRKDLISAMKLADNEPLSSEDFWGIGDPWKQEWERGVQVPVNPDSLPESAVKVTTHKTIRDRESTNFRLTKDKLIRVNHDEFFSNEQHILSNLPTKAEKMCRYDMDDLDDQWLTSYNGERARMGAAPVPPLIFEMIIEHLEETCWENIHKMLKTEESQSMEFDEDVICDVCRSPDSEEGNEMVFCDSCNICVHQACYGITAIPSGSWLCRTCSLGIKPDCVLCPNKGGAMKSTKSGQKWAHVACALWIPEVSIGSVDRMEPITKIPNIPQSRWALVCVLCRERRGACIQCSVKTCKTAYHVTCAFKHGLEMKAIIEDESADDGVKLRSYCEKHSVSNKKMGKEEGESEEGDVDSTAPKKKKDWSSEQKNQARAAKLRQIESEFFKHVNVLETSNFLDIDFETTETIFNYWKLKRRSSFNKPLLTPRSEEIDLLSQQQEHDIERMKMFVQLRQYLERVRNLCYMVNRRERLSRSFIKTREQTFSKQVALLVGGNLTPQEAEAIKQANHGPSVYDQLFSHPAAPRHTQKQFNKLVAAMTGSPGGAPAPVAPPRKPPQKKDINGLVRPKKEKSENPYKKQYMNGADTRRSRSSSMYSSTDSDSSLACTKWTLPAKSTGRLPVYTSSEEEPNKENQSLKFEPSTPKPRPFLHISDKDKDGGEGGGATMGVRGRPGRRKRGTGRAGVIKNKSFRDKVSGEVEDNDTKVFDALIADKAVKIEPNTSSSRSTTRVGGETSEDETEAVPPKPKPQPARRRNKKKVTPPKVDTSASSEDDPPAPTLTPAKEVKKPPPPVKKGRWSKVTAADTVGVGAVGSEATSASSPALEPPKLELSDDDELMPPTYKLSSDDDDKSQDGVVLSSDQPDPSDQSDSSSETARPSTLGKSPKKPDKKGETVSCDSDVSDDDKDGTTDSQNHAALKTKAAKKEFTPKIEAKMERMNKKKGGRGGRKPVVEKVKSEGKPTEEVVEVEAASTKLTEVESTQQGHLFVPQRKAAKKASELITSQNTTSTAATTTTATATTPNTTTLPPAPSVPETKKPTTKPTVKDTKEELSEVEVEEKKVVEKKVVEEKKAVEEKKTTPTKARKGKAAAAGREKSDRTITTTTTPPPTTIPTTTTTEETKTEAADTPKKNLFEPPEILPYVPMRQAARKAAENLKGGGTTKTGAPTPTGPEEVKEAKEVKEPEPLPAPAPPPAKNKRISRQENKASGRAKSKSPRALKQQTSPAAASDRESESEVESPTKVESPSKVETPTKVESPTIIRKLVRDPKEAKEIQKVSKVSDSEEEGLAASRKDRPALVRADPLLEAAKQVNAGEPFFRGEVFVREYQSSSDENESTGHPTIPSKKGHPSPGQGESEEREDSRTHQPFCGVQSDLHLTSDSDEREDENQEPDVGTRRKAPDKKLKTSEGRPEHGFQPPVTKRGESRVSAEKEASSATTKLGNRRDAGGLESRLRQSGTECGPRAGPGDLAQQDLPGHTDAPPLRTGRRGGGREREPPPPLSRHHGPPAVQPAEHTPHLRPSKKVTEGVHQEKQHPPHTTRGSTAIEKKEAVKEPEVLRHRREGLRDKGEKEKEKLETGRLRDKGEVGRGRERAETLKGEAGRDKEKVETGKGKDKVETGRDKVETGRVRDKVETLKDISIRETRDKDKGDTLRDKGEASRERNKSEVTRERDKNEATAKEKGKAETARDRNKTETSRERNKSDAKTETSRERNKSDVSRERNKSELIRERERGEATKDIPVMKEKEEVEVVKESEEKVDDVVVTDKNDKPPSLTRERIQPPRERVIPPREKATNLRGPLLHREAGRETLIGKDKRENLRNREEKVEKETERRRKEESSKEEIEVPLCKPQDIPETPVELPKLVAEVPVLKESKIPETLPVLKEVGKETGESVAREKEEDTRRKLGVFGYVEDEEVKVGRLADIVETSDTEPENKKVRIGDSDEEIVAGNSVSLGEKRRVEQPKDSGYKSAINTPEPVDRAQAGCSELVTVNTVVNNFLPEAACGDVAESTEPETIPTAAPIVPPVIATPTIPAPPPQAPPTLTLTPSPTDLKQQQHSLNKFVSPTKKKNLEDVIGEMKRQAEIHPEPRPEPPPSSSPHSEASAASPPPSTPTFPQPSQPECSTNASQAPNDGSMGKSGSSNTAASFVEQWRGQWVKSPPPAEHKSDPPGTLPSHLPMPGLDMGPMMLDMQRAMYPDGQHQPMYNPFELLNAHGMEAFRFHRMMGTSLYNPNLARFQQHSAATPDIGTLGQHPYLPTQSSRDADKPETQDRMRLPVLDAPSPSPDVIPPNNKGSGRPGTKVAKPLPSPLLAAPPHPSPPTKVLPGLPSPSTTTTTTITPTTTISTPAALTTTTTTTANSISIGEREEPVLPHNKTAPVQVSPSSVFKKDDLVEITDRSVLVSRVTRASDSHLFSVSNKIPPPATSPIVAASEGATKAALPLTSPPINSVFGSKKSVVTPLSSPVIAPPRPSPTLPSTTTSSTSTTTTSITTTTTSITSSTTTSSTTSTPTTTSTIKSPLLVLGSPKSQREAPSPQVETITVEDSPAPQREEQTPTTKRVPIYMQEPRAPRQEKRSPRSRTLSPRYKEPPKPKEKRGGKAGRGGYNKGRGRSAGKGKGRGHSPRFNSISVPKELVGTVYDFDFDNEFDDDGPANNTLDDLRRSREKRQSVDAPPQQQEQIQQQQQQQQEVPPHQQPSTPTYTFDQKEQSPKKSSKKSKSTYKDKGSSRVTAPEEDGDKVAKILEDYRNMQNSQLRRSVHSPTPPQPDALPEGPPKTPDALHSVPQFTSENNLSECKLTIVPVSEMREAGPLIDMAAVQKEAGEHGKVSMSVPTAHLGIDERTNQLKLKIKGPYANSYSSSSIVTPATESLGAPAPASTTSTLRRMRKKELIRQYQDTQPSEASEAGPTSSTPNPTPHVRTGITIPKAVASMTSIPTREDYKMYTQDDSASGSRRKRPSREIRQLNVWAIRDESGKRNSESVESMDPSRKRARGSKDSKGPEEKDVWSAKPPPKIRISLGKKGSEVTTVPPDPSSSKQLRPPKKRLAEENPMVKIKSDSMKFREQMMASFDKPGKKGADREKRNKKRRVYSGDGGSGSEAKDGESSDKHDFKVISGDSTNTPKLVIRFGKGNKSENSGGSGSNGGGGGSRGGSDDPDALAPSLKIRLSLPKPDSDSSKEDSSSIPKVPLKLKLSRRPDGYVASNTPRKPHTDVQDQGPGPPAARPPEQPPDQPPLELPPDIPQVDESVVDTSTASPTCPLPPQPHPHPAPSGPSSMSEPPPDPGIPQDTPPPPIHPGAPYEVYPHQTDPPTAGGQEQLGLGPAEYGLGGLGPPGLGPPPPRPELPDEMMQRLLAEAAGQQHLQHQQQQQQQQTLLDVPGLHHALYPYKEGSDCR